MLIGLDEQDARALLAAAIPGRLDERVRDRIVAETRGNPLALMELPRGLTAAQLAGGFALPDAGSLPDRLKDHYLRRLAELPEPTQQLMLLAAADSVGDATVVRRAAQSLGIEADAFAPAEDAELLEVRARVRFRHPLVRSAVYRGSHGGSTEPAHAAPATPPIRRSILICAPGIAPTRQSVQTVRWPKNWCAARALPSAAAVSPPRRHSWSMPFG
jgi:hypothetical protein